jgi:hypothetical protein
VEDIVIFAVLIQPDVAKRHIEANPEGVLKFV